jgi:hypothetical protein
MAKLTKTELVSNIYFCKLYSFYKNYVLNINNSFITDEYRI